MNASTIPATASPISGFAILGSGLMIALANIKSIQRDRSAIRIAHNDGGAPTVLNYSGDAEAAANFTNLYTQISTAAPTQSFALTSVFPNVVPTNASVYDPSWTVQIIGTGITTIAGCYAELWQGGVNKWTVIETRFTRISDTSIRMVIWTTGDGTSMGITGVCDLKYYDTAHVDPIVITNAIDFTTLPDTGTVGAPIFDTSHTSPQADPTDTAKACDWHGLNGTYYVWKPGTGWLGVITE